MSDYSQKEMERMQSEATNRARDMHKRAHASSHEHHDSPEPCPPEPCPPLPLSPKNSPTQSETPHKGGFDISSLINLKGINLKGIFGDNDKLLVILLIFMLMGENTDELLLIALLYIIL